MLLATLSALKWMDFFPWALSALSMSCVYCLNNFRVKLGRYLGLVVACGWFFFGYMTSQWFFLFTNVIYAYIYISAIVKFNKKRDEYRHITEEQSAQLQEIEAKLRKEQMQFSARLNVKHARMKKVARSAHAKAEQIARETRLLVRTIERLDNSLHDPLVKEAVPGSNTTTVSERTASSERP